MKIKIIKEELVTNLDTAVNDWVAENEVKMIKTDIIFNPININVVAVITYEDQVINSNKNQFKKNENS